MKETSQTDSGYSLRLMFLFAALIACIGWMAVNFSQINQRESQQRQVLNHVSALRVHSQSLGKAALRAVSGNVQALSEVEYARGQYEANVGRLEGRDVPTDGDIQKLTMPSEAATQAVKKISDIWAKMRGDVDRILARRETLVATYGLASTLNAQLEQVQSLSEEVAERLVASNAPASQINLTSQQLVLLERLRRNSTEILKGGPDATRAPNQFVADAVRFGQILQGLISGDRELKIERVADAQVRGKLGEVASASSDRVPLLGYRSRSR